MVDNNSELSVVNASDVNNSLAIYENKMLGYMAQIGGTSKSNRVDRIAAYFLVRNLYKGSYQFAEFYGDYRDWTIFEKS